MTPNDYPIIRPLIRVGDIFAFGGRGFISGGIKLFTRSAVSHVATVFRTEEDRVLLIESTTLNDKKGVQTNPASERISSYDGNVWWLPLSESFRKRVDWGRFLNFLSTYEDRKIPYDKRQCLRMAFAPLAHIPGIGFLRNHEDLKKVYCSELIAAALEYADGLPPGTNCSDITPQDLCELKIYDFYAQIRGKKQNIRKFNTLEVSEDCLLKT